MRSGRWRGPADTADDEQMFQAKDELLHPTTWDRSTWEGHGFLHSSGLCNELSADNASFTCPRWRFEAISCSIGEGDKAEAPFKIFQMMGGRAMNKQSAL